MFFLTDILHVFVTRNENTKSYLEMLDSNIMPAYNFALWENKKSSGICLVQFGFLINCINRLLSISIAFYRFVFVVKSSWVKTQLRRKVLGCFLTVGVIVLSTTLFGFCVYYREQYYHFLGKFIYLRLLFQNTPNNAS